MQEDFSMYRFYKGEKECPKELLGYYFRTNSDGKLYADISTLWDLEDGFDH